MSIGRRVRDVVGRRWLGAAGISANSREWPAGCARSGRDNRRGCPPNPTTSASPRGAHQRDRDVL